ncbi:MAG: phosphotransferase [Pseudomonadota bacterium]
MTNQVNEIKMWVSNLLPRENFTIGQIAGDASFRKYYRVKNSAKSYIVMYAPPEKEDTQIFIKISQLFANAGINVPKIIEHNEQQGLILLTDFGDDLYLYKLNSDNSHELYRDAIRSLHEIQKISATSLPEYTTNLLVQEMELFTQWYLKKHLSQDISANMQKLIKETHGTLVKSALEQPAVTVHRDYHSRNLIYTNKRNPAIIDYQDAVAGPITYDLVSLLRDCYINWEEEQIINWINYYKSSAEVQSLISGIDDKTFIKWFDYMGIQRHLKAIGIFCRLNYRDNKNFYLDDIPRTMQYILDVSKKYPELNKFHNLIMELI